MARYRMITKGSSLGKLHTHYFPEKKFYVKIDNSQQVYIKVYV